ncbi:MAG TPA: septum formation initiator family protein [Candidatus Portnoybacteria bacterium]|nr:septum formation initiator family protein [Candidatus Portnoybacteria bacterium]
MTRGPRKNLFLRILSSKIFLLFGLIILGSIVVGLGRESYHKWQIKREIAALQTEIEELERGNQELANLLEYFKTESFKEKEAREKLNLQKPGEKVVLMPSLEQTEEEKEMKGEGEKGVSNSTKWWKYLFASKDN